LGKTGSHRTAYCAIDVIPAVKNSGNLRSVKAGHARFGASQVFTDPRIEYRIKPSIFLIFNHLCHFPEGREIQPGIGVRIKPGMAVSGIYLPIQLAREKATNTITQCHHNHLALLKMLNKDGKINDAIIENMLPWGRCGFHVYLSPTI
jgi:hypothetical protein